MFMMNIIDVYEHKRCNCGLKKRTTKIQLIFVDEIKILLEYGIGAELRKGLGILLQGGHWLTIGQLSICWFVLEQVVHVRCCL